MVRGARRDRDRRNSHGRGTGGLPVAGLGRRRVAPGREVRPGLWSIPVPIPVPIPDNPLRYVLVYAFELPNGVAIVDAGWDTDEAWTALVEGLTKAGCDITDVSALLITHIHPDHYGLAGRGARAIRSMGRGASGTCRGAERVNLSEAPLRGIY